jgi:hypothetical protein
MILSIIFELITYFRTRIPTRIPSKDINALAQVTDPGPGGQ